MKKLKKIIYTIIGIVTAAVTALLIYTASGGFDTTAVSDYFIRRVRAPLTNAHTVTFDMDYRVFLEDNTVFNADIATVSLFVNSHPSSPSFMRDIGLGNIETLYLGENTDTDQTVMSIGHRRVEYSGAVHEIILLYISDNLMHNEWFSYFDVGADISEYFDISGSIHPDWLDKSNHKGFDVAANRIISSARDYMGRLGLEGQTTLWVTGFGRGGAVANIVGAYFENEPEMIAFTYAFAAPNVTANLAAREYQTIFNIINEDDMIPLFPPAEWGFTRFGRDLSMSLAADEVGLELFTELGGGRYLRYEEKEAVIAQIVELIPTREAMYRFEEGAFVITGEFEERAEAEQIKERLETVLEAGLDRAAIVHLAKLNIYELPDSGEYRLVHYQSNAFFLKTLAEIAAGGHIDRRNVAEIFMPARISFDRAFRMGFRRPHSFAAHYVIIDNL